MALQCAQVLGSASVAGACTPNETQMVKNGARHLFACMCARNRVLVHWRDDSAHYPAIIDDYDKGCYHLLYDDGYFFVLTTLAPPSTLHVIVFQVAPHPGIPKVVSMNEGERGL